MSDEELERRILDFIEKAGGPEGVFVKMDWAPEEHPEIRDIWQKHELA